MEENQNKNSNFYPRLFLTEPTVITSVLEDSRCFGACELVMWGDGYFFRKANWNSDSKKNTANLMVSSFSERNSESDPEPAERWVIHLWLLDLPWVSAGVHVTSGIGFLKWMLNAHCVHWWRNDLYPTDKHSPVIPTLMGGSYQMSWSMGACVKIDCKRWTTVLLHWENWKRTEPLCFISIKGALEKQNGKDGVEKYWSIMMEVISKDSHLTSHFMAVETAEIHGKLIYHNTQTHRD